MKRVTVTFVPGRASPWMVRYYVNGDPIRSFHKTEDLADTAAAELEKLLAKEIDPADLKVAIRMGARSGLPISELVKLGLDSLSRSTAIKASPTAKFKEGAAMVIARAKKKNRRQCTIDSYVSVFDILNKEFGDRCAATITQGEVEAYLAKYKGRGGNKPASATTQCHIVRYFKMALKCLKIVGTLDDIILPEREEGPIDFFSAEEAISMIRLVPDHLKGLLIVAFFAALRPALLSKLPAHNVDCAKRRIKIPAYLAKDKRSHTLCGRFDRSSGEQVAGTLPDTMWPLLAKFPYQPGKWDSIRQYLKRHNQNRWVHDGTRRTAATFHDRFFGKQSTAALLTHAGESLVYEHYVGDTTPEQADAFYSMAPSDFPSVPDVRQGARFTYPAEAQLRRLVEQEPLSTIAKGIGCSWPALAKHCRKLGIPTKSCGYWAKVAFGKVKLPALSQNE